jgi:hypothetical protein
MRETGDGQNVRQLRRQAGVGVGRVFIVKLGLLGGLGAEERRVIGPFAVDQGDETAIRQFLFTAVRNCDFRRALQRHVAFVGAESVARQAFHQAAAFHSANRGAPADTTRKRW